MSGSWIKEHMKAIYLRYKKASRTEKTDILNEFCQTHHCHRKHAVRVLNGPLPTEEIRESRRREPLYAPAVIAVLQAIWEAAGYLWSRRLKAALPLWIPWARRRFSITPEQERLLLSISPSQIDRRLAKVKHKLKRRIYGRTKPGSLLKHQIPIKTDSWNIRRPGFLEIDLVSHSGSSAEGLFAYTLDMVDIKTGWVARRAILGKDQKAVRDAIDEMAQDLPFPLLGLDSDNGSEFINELLYVYCKARKVQFTRGRPYKKDDNAHIEQKNWTHVRQLFGYVRYDTREAVDAMNRLYRCELDWYQNFYQPSVKLAKKIRIGSKIKRLYRDALTPFQRLLDSKGIRADKVKTLRAFKEQLDPFALAKIIDDKLKSLYEAALHRKASSTQKEISSASPLILVRPGKHQQFKIKGHVPQGPAPDPLEDLRYDPVFKLQQQLERQAMQSP